LGASPRHPARPLHVRVKGRSLSGRDAAFAMPLVFPVILLLILGALTMVSRSTNTFLAASKQSDAQAARQAAESGMNRVLRVLRPIVNNATDP